MKDRMGQTPRKILLFCLSLDSKKNKMKYWKNLQHKIVMINYTQYIPNTTDFLLWKVYFARDKDLKNKI